MGTDLSALLMEFNQFYKEAEDIYHNYAKENGLSDASFWVLYSLWEQSEACTQRELSRDWFYPPQTVNSALKVLERKGLIQLEEMKGNRRSKQILFTPKGKSFCESIIAPLIEAECKAFSALSEQERKALLSATRKHVVLLRQEVNQIPTLSSEDCSPQ